MVDSVSPLAGFDAAAYLNRIKGLAPPAPPAAKQPSLFPASLQSPNPLGVSSDVLSVLQSTSPSSFQGQQLFSLLGGTGQNNALGGLYAVALGSNSSLAPIQQALAALQQQKTQLSTQSDFTQNAIGNFHTATNAYNQVLLANAQAALEASYQVPPITA